MSVAALSLRGLSKHYGETSALEEVSLEVAQGQLLALLGPSGCGKTTLLRLIAGLLEPDTGEVRLAGQRVSHLPSEKRELGMVFQRPTLFPHLDVAANVGFGLKMRGTLREEVSRRVAEALDAVQLTGFERRKPRQLSGGQQQRVAIARAVVTRPKLLLMDEPFSSLDALLREEMRALVRNLQGALGITTVFVTHDQTEALELADVLGVMFNGEVAQLGTPQEVFEKPVNAQVAQFMGATNLLTGSVEAGVLTTSLGRIPLNEARGVSGDSTVVIRPEYLTLCPYQDKERREAESPLTGIVTKAVYRGGVTRYEVEVCGDEESQTLFAQMSASVPFTAGERVSVTLPAEHLWLLPQNLSKPAVTSSPVLTPSTAKKQEESCALSPS